MTEPTNEPVADLARQAGELTDGEPAANQEPPFVEAEIVDDEPSPQSLNSVKFMNVFHGTGPGKLIQVDGTLNIGSLDDL